MSKRRTLFYKQAPEKIYALLSGTLVLSSKRSVPIAVEIEIPKDVTRAEAKEIENARIAVHDLEPHTLRRKSVRRR